MKELKQALERIKNEAISLADAQVIALEALKSNESSIDYAWPTIADYEKDAGFEVNFAFESGWRMARTTNSFLNLMNKEKD